MSIDEEFEDLKETIREMVNMFKTVWDEVEHQFSKLSREERQQIFSLVAPLIADMFAMAAEEVTKDVVKPNSKRKKRR